MTDNMTLRGLCEANAHRAAVWPGGEKIDLAFLGLEIGEEAGEVQGALKKIIRQRKGIAGNTDSITTQDLLQKFKDEAADLFINLSRACNALGVDPDEVIRDKFNRSSRKVGVDVFL